MSFRNIVLLTFSDDENLIQFLQFVLVFQEALKAKLRCCECSHNFMFCLIQLCVVLMMLQKLRKSMVSTVSYLGIKVNTLFICEVSEDVNVEAFGLKLMLLLFFF